MKKFPDELKSLVEMARQAKPERRHAQMALRCLDLTSLNDNDTPEVISALTAKADQGALGHVAATCVYPRFLTQTFNETAGKGINRATVINFPQGRGTAESTLQATTAAIASGANEIDIVVDYERIKAGDMSGAASLLRACKQACNGKAQMKVILESAAFDNAKELFRASVLAIACGADYLKTSTGKSPAGGATLEAAAVMLTAIRMTQTQDSVGLKISGGVKSVADYAQYMALTEHLMGKDWIAPERFRFGASGVLTDILATLGKPDSPSGPTAKPPVAGY